MVYSYLLPGLIAGGKDANKFIGTQAYDEID